MGSAQLVTDYEGNEYQRIEYTPYGELWVEKKTEREEGLRYLPYKFTAKEQDEETGLYYYGARYLDAKYSRWLSADPAVNDYVSGTSAGEGGIYNTVNFSLYHYAGNNPIAYTDPDGRDVKNNTKKYIVARTEDDVTVMIDGDEKKLHNVILKPGDYAEGGFDGAMDSNGDMVKVSANDNEIVNFSVEEDGASIKLNISDDNSKKLNNKNDIKKKTWNMFVPKVKEKDLSGNYKGQNKKGKTLFSWWKQATENASEPGKPEEWEKNYNSEEQKALRQKLKVRTTED